MTEQAKEHSPTIADLIAQVKEYDAGTMKIGFLRKDGTLAAIVIVAVDEDAVVLNDYYEEAF